MSWSLLSFVARHTKNEEDDNGLKLVIICVAHNKQVKYSSLCRWWRGASVVQRWQQRLEVWSSLVACCLPTRVVAKEHVECFYKKSCWWMWSSLAPKHRKKKNKSKWVANEIKKLTTAPWRITNQKKGALKSFKELISTQEQ
jgi:hypothetical protein